MDVSMTTAKTTSKTKHRKLEEIGKNSIEFQTSIICIGNGVEGHINILYQIIYQQGLAFVYLTKITIFYYLLAKPSFQQILRSVLHQQ